ncbi:hypothetical protein Kpol_224p4 [Vanderwaltozyma polyspora DSM 70294]|uniref:Uncharacterized protein n=1 Tax=Vanderwaltozyma polyspora (strain ATCC 22028 / DSM 70294 / BCRC 21397 / CBS 2163 / NBRC 10782 / NRRL Y-8283 / UCD 57-17) TaxID=436907 RepID=A7TTG4_VANPO|nr:uncharacterized protein Kpol_224p4 [Vanderwaltozyma polyspora DSM 70294]EDO14446.1 hypothetical protein Kpol_224p4 [Vanderwaltozyma polyspora DSM 70294]
MVSTNSKNTVLSLFSALTLSGLVSSAPVAAPALSDEVHHKHGHVDKRSGTCQFPNYDGMVAVQTQGSNAGWAMHSDQQCTFGSWCPYACKPGQLMGQWDPSVTSYSYPGSQYGGLYCDNNGILQTPDSSKAYCYEGAGTVLAKNTASGGNVAFCQTVLPGNEEMLIPTDISSGGSQTLAVPGPEYWAGTASHFYVNPPGVSVDDGCKWGSTSNPWGNWSPYVAGANIDANKNTYVKIGWNPVYLEATSPFKDSKPSFGIRITCDDESQCDGLPCSIDPNSQSINGVNSASATDGAGGAGFCVVTAKNGAKANIEIF